MELSNPQSTSSRWPDIAADPAGNVHVVWSSEGAVFYRRWDGQSWSQPVDIFLVRRQAVGDFFPPDVWIPKIAADQYGKVHVTWSDLYHLFYGWAPVNAETWKATIWSGPTILATNRPGPYSDVAVDSQGNVHVVYNGLPESGGLEYEGVPCLCHDAYYIRSPDNGKTWSEPVDLFPSPELDNRIRITVDNLDILHVAWDANNGNDNQDGLEPGERGVYIRSTNRGLTWDKPQPIVYDGWVRYPRVAYDGAGNILLTWTYARAQMWSADSGATWRAPSTLPAPAGGEANEVSLDAATDSDGNIHVVLAGYNPNTRENDIYHLVWNGQQWSAPVNISKSPGLESVRPKIAVSLGNVLHVVWEEIKLAEPGNWQKWEAVRVYHSMATTSAAAMPKTVFPTPTSPALPTNSQPTQPTAKLPEPTNVPTAARPIETGGAKEAGAVASSNRWFPLIVGVVPVIFLICVVIVVHSWRASRG